MKLAGGKQKKKVQEESVGQLHVYSYKLLNEHVKFLHPKLTSLDKSIKQAMMPIPFEVYVSRHGIFQHDCRRMWHSYGVNCISIYQYTTS